MSEPLLEFSGAARRYGDGERVVNALRPVTLTINAGEFVCVAGPSGSGKTTLLNLAGLLDRPTQGEVLLSGAPTGVLTKAERAELRRKHLGFVFQSANLLPVLTVLENVEFGLLLRGRAEGEARTIAKGILDRVGVAQLWAKRPRELSGGQRQRVAVARAIAGNPPLVIADEPTASLDGETALALLELFRELNANEGIAFLFSSHDNRVISSALRVLRLADGRLEE